MMKIQDAAELNRQIPNINQSQEAAKTGEPQSQLISTPNTDTLSGVVKDSVELSEFAKFRIEKAAQVNQYLSELQKIKSPTARDIENIRSKLKSDFYQQPEVIDKILEGLTQLPTIANNMVITDKDTGVPSTENTLDKIGKKIQEGFYDSDEILDVIVTRMMNENDY
jgi:molecular chaperone GrpE (heat shock protein)